jgi:choline dehydrogenase-like flavoprotein
VQAAGKLWRDLSQGRMPSELGERVVTVLGDIGGLTESAFRKLVQRRRVNRPPELLRLHAYLDPKPNPDSRVTLINDRDALGMPRIQLDWRLTAEDERSMALLVRRVADELTRLGHGRVRLHQALEVPDGGWARAGNLIGYDVAPDAPPMHVSWHHMGTTRMASDPRAGVVDANCRVHGTANLFVAGSSVFPTTGIANPTLTICAMALRLADHLKEIGLAPAPIPAIGNPGHAESELIVTPHAADTSIEG